jgi:hypothetical protein
MPDLQNWVFGMDLPQKPKWLRAMVDEVSQGVLERAIHRAISVCTGIY